MFKNQMKPMQVGGSPKGSVHKHAGKGSAVKTLSSHNNVGSSGSGASGATLNNYAKATPMAQPAPTVDGLGSGSWPGIGQ